MMAEGGTVTAGTGASQPAGAVRIRRALISVSDKLDLVPFARGLREMGVEIISTGGTARALQAADVDVIGIESVTGFPEMMDGRVKSLHPLIHGALLGRRDVPAHMDAMKAHGITPIDLVCVNLYPFEETILNTDISDEEAIEQIDIGGPSMLRSAAKNHHSVTVITAVDQYDRVISEMRSHDGATTYDTRRDLAAAAFMRTAEYDTAISAWMCSRRPVTFPTLLRMTYAHQLDLNYGENPHQAAALYSNPAAVGPSLAAARMVCGKSFGYNNVNDAAAALDLVHELAELYPDRAGATVIKHANPCGAAIADTVAEAVDRANAGDPLAAYGGILAVNRPIDRKAAEHICSEGRFLEVIVAPDYDDEAIAMIDARWQNIRVLAVSGIGRTTTRSIEYRSIPGGMLAQERDTKPANPDEWVHAAGPVPTERVLADAAFTWTACKHLKSNAIAIGHGGAMIGAGMGQVDRVTACRLAVMRAGDRIKEGHAVAASDAFFPFPDGPEVLIDAGVKCLVQPGGSKRDKETVDLCDAHGVTCLITGARHFRH